MNQPTLEELRHLIDKEELHRLSLIQRFGKPIPVLDKGHVRLVDLMGHDVAVVQAARTSYGKGYSTHKWALCAANLYACDVCGEYQTSLTTPASSGRCDPGDKALVRYLMRHHHGTPFEMCEAKFHIKMPMDAHRQQIRHRTANVNEFSTRYTEVELVIESDDPDMPLRIVGLAETEPDQWRLQSRSSKQGSDGWLQKEEGERLSAKEREFLLMAHEVYQERIRMGVAKELARKDLPLSTYTMYFWKMDLRNLLHYLGLRMDPHAQWEIRQYANTIAEIVKAWVPFTYSAFYDYVLHAHTFSRQEMDLIRHLAAEAFSTKEALNEGAGIHSDRRSMRKTLADEFDLGSDRERKTFWSALELL